MNAEDIRNVTFDKVMRGYRPEKWTLIWTRWRRNWNACRRKKSGCGEKMYILAEKVDQYRNDEER